MPLVLGSKNNADNTSAVVIGSTNFAGLSLVAIGSEKIAFAEGSVAPGKANNADGLYFSAAGLYTTAIEPGECTAGSFNDLNDIPNPARTQTIEASSTTWLPMRVHFCALLLNYIVPCQSYFL